MAKGQVVINRKVSYKDLEGGPEELFYKFSDGVTINIRVYSLDCSVIMSFFCSNENFCRKLLFDFEKYMGGDVSIVASRDIDREKVSLKVNNERIVNEQVLFGDI